MDILTILALVAGVWVIGGTIYLAWHAHADSQQARTLLFVHFLVRACQIVLLGAPVLLKPSFTGWMLAGVLLLISIAADMWLNSIERRLPAKDH